VDFERQQRFGPAPGPGPLRHGVEDGEVDELAGGCEFQNSSLVFAARALAVPRRRDDPGLRLQWRAASGRAKDGDLIIPRPSGGQWSREDWANWRRRIWRPAAIEPGVTGDLRPYRLRGSFVSLLLWEGRSLTYVAEQAGHSVATLARHYAGTMRELETEPRIPAAEAIRQVREQISGTH
jgi:hypothetical protein